jgi:Flp pilus assembly protein TadG
VTGRARDDRGAGMISSLAGLTVFLLFLLLAVQVLVGLYATSTIRATLHDAASRAAAGGAGTDPADLARLSDQAEASLGAMGDRTDIELRLVDDDGDGTGDVIAGEAVAVPPRFVPRSVGGMLGFEDIRASVRVRVERFR